MGSHFGFRGWVGSELIMYKSASLQIRRLQWSPNHLVRMIKKLHITLIARCTGPGILCKMSLKAQYPSMTWNWVWSLQYWYPISLKIIVMKSRHLCNHYYKKEIKEWSVSSGLQVLRHTLHSTGLLYDRNLLSTTVDKFHSLFNCPG